MMMNFQHLDDNVVKRILTKSHFSKNPTDEDKKNLIDLCKKFFNADGTRNYKTDNLIKEFTAIVVEMVDKDMLTTMNETIGYVADVVNASGLDIYQYDVEQEFHGSAIRIANGTFVDTERASGQGKNFAIPKLMGGGVHFSQKALYHDAFTTTQKLIEDIYKEKKRKVMDAFYSLSSAAVISGKIPAKNILNKSNSTISEFRRVSSYVGRNQANNPTVFIADPLLIDYYDNLQANNSAMNSDKTKEDFRNMNTRTIANAVCVGIENPWTDETNTNVQYPVNIGVLVNGGNTKPFRYFEFGGTTSETLYDDITGRVSIMIKWKNDFQLLYGNRLGYVKEGTVSL